MRVSIERLWDGTVADERYYLELSLDDTTHELVVDVDAPFFGDPAPDAARGSVENLYEFEVVELFLFGSGERYLEVELGPAGHYLALTFEGVRQPLGTVAIVYDTPSVAHERWNGRARIPTRALPPEASRVNAHASHGRGGERRWLSAAASAGSRPDFHRPDVAVNLEPELARKLERAHKSLESDG